MKKILPIVLLSCALDLAGCASSNEDDQQGSETDSELHGDYK